MALVLSSMKVSNDCFLHDLINFYIYINPLKASFGEEMSSNHLEMMSNHFTVENSDQSDHQGPISSINPFFTESFCLEKFAYFNEIPSCVPPPLYSSFPTFNREDPKVKNDPFFLFFFFLTIYEN